MDTQSRPTITVLMSIYKDKEYLAEAIESILRQTYKDFEFLIVAEPEMPQETLEIIRRFRDKRIRLIINKKHLGFANSLNKGIRLARGQYIARMDADDVSHPNRLLIQLIYMKLHPHIAMCGSGVRQIDAQGKVFNIVHQPTRYKEIKANLFFNNCIYHPTVIINTKVFKKEAYKYKNQIAEDYELWSRMCFHYKIRNIYFCLVDRRYHGNNMIFVKKDESKMVDVQIQKRMWEHQGIEYVLERPFYDTERLLPSERRKRTRMINLLEQKTENCIGKKDLFQSFRKLYL